MLLVAGKVDAHVHVGPYKLSMFHDMLLLQTLKIPIRNVRHLITDI